MVTERAMPYMLGALLVGGALLWVTVSRKGVAGIAESAGRAAVDMVDGVVAGTVKGIGEAVGIPDTDAQKAEVAMRQGDVLGVSLYAPAGTFVKWLASGMPQPGATGAW